MDDEQIARAFVQQMRHSYDFGAAVSALTAIIGEARSTERTRCVTIASRVSTAATSGQAQITAWKIRAAIEEE